MFIILSFAGIISSNAQIHNDEIHELQHTLKSDIRMEMSIPGFDNYLTLKCDFHNHTIFSDGDVWPTTRVQEAWQEGLDAIAITDHIEYRPHKSMIIADLNESFKIAKKEGDKIGFIVIHGIEITRSKPLGHINALFINDGNPMETENPLDAIDIAVEQGAYIQWNHPGWPDDRTTLYPVHEELIKAGKLHSVEVVNYAEWYPLAFEWCKQYDIAPAANTDSHQPVSLTYGRSEKNWRPMTLVFAEEKTEESIKEALFACRTAALFDGVLFSKPEYLTKLIKASLKVNKINDKIVEVTNISDIAYEMTNNGRIFYFPARRTVRIPASLTGKVVFKNCYVGLHQNLTLPIVEK